MGDREGYPNTGAGVVAQPPPAYGQQPQFQPPAYQPAAPVYAAPRGAPPNRYIPPAQGNPHVVIVPQQNGPHVVAYPAQPYTVLDPQSQQHLIAYERNRQRNIRIVVISLIIIG